MAEDNWVSGVKKTLLIGVIRSIYKNLLQSSPKPLILLPVPALLPGPVLPGNKGKHWVGGGPTKNIPPSSDKRFLTLLPTPELSRTPEPLILLAGRPARKQRKTLGLVLLPSDKHPLTLLPIPEPLILLPGPVPPGNKGKHWVGGDNNANAKVAHCHVQSM